MLSNVQKAAATKDKVHHTELPGFAKNSKSIRTFAALYSSELRNKNNEMSIYKLTKHLQLHQFCALNCTMQC